MNVLVTGGAGHVAKDLARAGYLPVVLDNLITGHRYVVRWGPLVHGDLNNEGVLRALFQRYRIDVVIHFAASTHVGDSMCNPTAYFRNNTLNTLNLLDAMCEAAVNKIVFSSTCATYGVARQIPIPEDHVQRPVNPYGESKLMAERTLQWYDQEGYQ